MRYLIKYSVTLLKFKQIELPETTCASCIQFSESAIGTNEGWAWVKRLKVKFIVLFNYFGKLMIFSLANIAESTLLQVLNK